MTKIIIVGHPQSDIESIEQLLIAAGMATARPSRRDGLRAQEINATLIKAHGVIPVESVQHAEQLQQIQVAPVWQGMVLDLMLNNLDHPLWGWADHQAVYLLDYWKDLDPKVVFVLAYDAPHTALTRLRLEEANASEEELQRRLDAWVAYNSALLHFHLRNPTRSVLVHTQQVKPAGNHYLQYLSERIALPLVLSDQDTWKTPEISAAPDTVSTLLGENAHIDVLIDLLIQTNPQAQTLYAELQAASTLASNLPQQGLLALTHPDGVHLRYRAWQACMTQQQQIQHLSQRIQEVSTQNTQLHAQVEQTQRAIDQAHQQAQAREAQHAYALKLAQQATQTQAEEQAQQLAAAQHKTREITQEKDSLQAQLQKIQKDLGQYQQEAEEHAAAIRAATSELQAKNKQLADAQKVLEKNKQQAQMDAKKSKEKSLELQQENDLILNQLHQVQEELERYYLENQEIKANQKPKAEIYYGAADRIKQELAYRLGSRMIAQSRSLGGCLCMPFALRAEVKKFRQSEAAITHDNLPPIAQYNDAHEAERVKKHLSYRLGARMLANAKSVTGWLTMPWALRAEIKNFQQERS